MAAFRLAPFGLALVVLVSCAQDGIADLTRPRIRPGPLPDEWRVCATDVDCALIRDRCNWDYHGVNFAYLARAEKQNVRPLTCYCGVNYTGPAAVPRCSAQRCTADHGASTRPSSTPSTRPPSTR